MSVDAIPDLAAVVAQFQQREAERNKPFDTTDVCKLIREFADLPQSVEEVLRGEFHLPAHVMRARVDFHRHDQRLGAATVADPGMVKFFKSIVSLIPPSQAQNYSAVLLGAAEGEPYEELEKFDQVACVNVNLDAAKAAVRKKGNSKDRYAFCLADLAGNVDELFINFIAEVRASQVKDTEILAAKLRRVFDCAFTEKSAPFLDFFQAKLRKPIGLFSSCHTMSQLLQYPLFAMWDCLGDHAPEVRANPHVRDALTAARNRSFTYHLKQLESLAAGGALVLFTDTVRAKTGLGVDTQFVGEGTIDEIVKQFNVSQPQKWEWRIIPWGPTFSCAGFLLKCRGVAEKLSLSRGALCPQSKS